MDAVGWKPYCSRLGRRALGAGALGWAQVAAGRWALAGAQGRAGGSSARARSASGRRRGRARAREGSGMAGRAGAQAAGRQARARQGAAGVGARPGRLGWPRAVHSAHFRSVLTHFFFFPESPNEHCSL